MKKKNIVFLLVDSVYEKNTHATSYRNSPMPFLDEIRKKSITCTNMHSQAPFTEAAIMPLLTGNDLLEKGGYLQKFKYRKPMSEEFLQQGYHTFINHKYPLIDPMHVFDGISDNYYMGFVDPLQLWGYRFEYYAPLYKEGKLSDHEIQILSELLESNFVFWIKQLKEILNNDEQTKLLYKFSTLDYIDEEQKEVQEAYDEFCKDKQKYLSEVMNQGVNHPFFKMQKLKINKKVTKENQKLVYTKYHAVFENIYKMNRNRNLKNNKLPIHSIFSAIKNNDFHSAKTYAAMYKAAVFDKDLYDRINPDYDVFKDAISMHSFIDDMFDWLDHKDHQKKPFFTYLHVDDCHAPETFFSYDSNDLNLLEKEFQDIQKFLKEVPQNFYGSLTAQLSYHYCDGCIRYLFDELEKRSLLDDTIVCICADHGFSYTYENFRTNYVNNQYAENFHPFFSIYGKDIKPEVKSGFFDTKDICPTLLEAAGCHVPDDIHGKSILSFAGRDYCTVEYMGGGCPDMLRRKMILGVRTMKYNVVVLVNVMKDFKERILDQVYDLNKDPNELVNIAQKVNNKDISYELSLIEKRFKEIQKDFHKETNSFQ